MGCPLIVVTGGIASGKTTVARVMAEAGGCLLDADAIARIGLRGSSYQGKGGVGIRRRVDPRREDFEEETRKGRVRRSPCPREAREDR